jgi:hypothetical protein
MVDESMNFAKTVSISSLGDMVANFTWNKTILVNRITQGFVNHCAIICTWVFSSNVYTQEGQGRMATPRNECCTL